MKHLFPAAFTALSLTVAVRPATHASTAATPQMQKHSGPYDYSGQGMATWKAAAADALLRTGASLILGRLLCLRRVAPSGQGRHRDRGGDPAIWLQARFPQAMQIGSHSEAT